MDVAFEDVKWFFQTHNKTELSLRIRKEEKSLKSIFKNPRQMLDRQHVEFKISILQKLYALAGIPIQWYTAISDIPAILGFEDDSHFCILQQVDIYLLISLLSCGNRDAFLDKELYRLFSQKKTDAVADFIESGSKLIPPSISYDAKSNSLKLQDGRHRFRAALIREQSHIPILINKRDYEVIFRMLLF